MDEPLKGIRVVELSRGLVVPAAGAILGDLGAEVIKIEPPGGHPERLDRGRAGPEIPDHCLPFALHNRGKRSIGLDLESDPDKLQELLSRSDVLLTDFANAELDSLELDRHARLIQASVTAFGSEGPDGDRTSSDDAAFYSRAGTTALMGAGRPFTFGHGQGARSTAFALTTGVLVALLRRDQNGNGGRVQTSLLAAGIYSIANDFTVALGTGEQPAVRDRRQPLNALGNSYRCRDGKWLMIGVASAAGQPAWERFQQMLDTPEWMLDARFATPESRREHSAELVKYLDDTFAGADRDAWGTRLRAAGLNWTPVPSPVDAVLDPQLSAAGLFVTVPGAQAATVATPLQMRGVSIAPRRGIPEPGAEREDILALLADGEDQPSPNLHQAVDQPRALSQPRALDQPRALNQPQALLPLDGIRVLDVSTYVAAPAVGSLLADLGAEVIKVEPPTGDARRLALTQLAAGDPEGLNRTFEMDNRNKKSITIALDHPEGSALVRRMATQCDIFLTNLLPPRQARFGLTPDEVLMANPNAIYASLTAYGTHGPDADMGGFDIQAFFARTGITGMLSRQAGAPPRPRSGQGDHITTLVIMTGILAALRRRALTGQGQVVETSLVAVGAYTIGSDILLALEGQEANGPVHPMGACYQCGDERWLQLAVAERDRANAWPLLCDLLGVARDVGTDAVAGATDVVATAIADAFATSNRQIWGERLTEASIAWVPVQTLPEVIADPQLEANAMIGSLEHPQHGSIRFVNPPYRIAGMETREYQRGPGIGEHTVEVLRDLGLEATEVEALRDGGVFGDRP